LTKTFHKLKVSIKKRDKNEIRENKKGLVNEFDLEVINARNLFLQ